MWDVCFITLEKNCCLTNNFHIMASLRENPGLKVKLLVGPTCKIPLNFHENTNHIFVSEKKTANYSKETSPNFIGWELVLSSSIPRYWMGMVYLPTFTINMNIPKCSMYGIFISICVVEGINEGKYTIPIEWTWDKYKEDNICLFFFGSISWGLYYE